MLFGAWGFGPRRARISYWQGVIDPYDDVPDGGSSDRGVRHPGVPWGRRSPDWFRTKPNTVTIIILL